MVFLLPFPLFFFPFIRQELENGLQLNHTESPRNKPSERGIAEEENKDDKEGFFLINMIDLSAGIIYYCSVTDLLSPVCDLIWRGVYNADVGAP